MLTIIISVIIAILIIVVIYLREIRVHANGILDLRLDSDGVIKVKRDEVFNILPKGYQFLDYSYSIKGCTLSTFHRDVTSSQYIFKTKHPIYTFIVYYNTGPHISYCPGSHSTTPLLFTSPRTIWGKKGDSYLFNCDLVHAGASNDYGDNRYVEQFKIAHVDDLHKLISLKGIKKNHKGDCNISKSNEIIQRNMSILFAYPINHVFTPLLQRKNKSRFVRNLIKISGKNFYNM